MADTNYWWDDYTTCLYLDESMADTELYFENSDSESESGSLSGDLDTSQENAERPSSSIADGTPKENTKEGELYKQGGVNRNQGWKRRYMRFDGKSLRYYKSKNSPVSLRIIPVSIMVNVQPLNQKERRPSSTSNISNMFSSGRAYQFELECTNRTFLFGTDDLNNAQQWESCLMAAIIQQKKTGGSLSEGGDMSNPDICIFTFTITINMTGLDRIEKKGSMKFDKNGKKFFVAIKGDVFRYYYNEQDYKVNCPIHELSLKLCSVKVLEPTKLKLSSPPNQHFVLNFMNVDEATQWEMQIKEANERSLGDNEILHDVRELVANQLCADCGSPNASWASINFGIVICAKCAGVHRGFGATISKVRSLRMDNIFKENKHVRQVLKMIGNDNANEFWYRHPSTESTPHKDMAIADRKIHITRKYLKRSFADLPTEDADELNKMFCGAVRDNDLQTTMRCLFSGAQIGYKSEGKTALEMAEQLGHTVMKEFLAQNETTELPLLFPKANGQTSGEIETKRTSVYHEGFLEKTGPNMRGYLKRWAVLHYGILSYYQDKGRTSPKGTVKIMDDIVSISTCSTLEKQFAFDISCKTNRRVYRFAAPDADSRTAWMSAIFKVICPSLILSEQIEDSSSRVIAGQFYVKIEQSSWVRAWITINGRRIDVWNMDSMCHCLTVTVATTSKLYKCNKGKESKLLGTPEDYRNLDNNQFTEIVTDQRLTKFQGILLKDTEKLYSLLDDTLKRLKK